MKRLIVCCDGTWNTPDQKDRGVMRPANVVKQGTVYLAKAKALTDEVEQLVNLVETGTKT